MINTVTFTGVDKSIVFENLKRISCKYPFVEFGILVGSKTSENPKCNESNRYPNLHFVGSFKRYMRRYNLRCSLHLCGKYSRTINMTSITALDRIEVVGLSNDFNRVQVNARYKDYNYSGIKWFADRAGCQKVIIQTRQQDFQKPLEHDKVEYLFDMSGGRGQEDFDKWPKPSLDYRMGYAGGISTDNIDQILEMIEAKWNPNCDIWLDMESGVRENDWMDLNKVEEICEKVQGIKR